MFSYANLLVKIHSIVQSLGDDSGLIHKTLVIYWRELKQSCKMKQTCFV